MTTLLSRRVLTGTLFVLIALAAMPLLAACGDDDDDAGSAGSGNNAAVILAITALDGAGFHGIDEAINDDKEIPANARTVALHMQAVTKLTEWPADQKATADKLADLLGQFAAELDKDSPDMESAGKLAADVHETEHLLAHDIWAHLQSEAGLSGDSGDGH